jgi:transcriptional regulator GlxA family with amidase domain
MKVQIIVFDGFDELDAIAPCEVLQRAEACGADIQVQLASLNGAAEVTAKHGLRMRPDARLQDGSSGEKPDLVIVAGGSWLSGAAQGVRAEITRGDIPKILRQLHESGTVLASVCTGAMLIAATGLLAGRPATTHHHAIEDLRGMGANIVQARVVDDGDIVTAGGITSGLDLALWLVERFVGSQLALQVEADMEYERRGTVWQRHGT